MRRKVRLLLPHAVRCESAWSSTTASHDLSEFEESSDLAEGSVLVEDEISQYLGYNPPPSNHNVLDCWKSQEQILPKLSELARRFLSVFATNTPSKRLFSQGSNIFTFQRASLVAQKLNDLLFLSWNLDSNK